MKNPLDQIETQLQKLVEGGTARLFSTAPRNKEILTDLVKAMQEGVKEGPNGSLLAPNLYILKIHPNLAQDLENEDAYLDRLADILSETGINAGYHFSSIPVIRIQPDPVLPEAGYSITAVDSQTGLTPTFDVTLQIEKDPGAIPKNAFLIVNGINTFILNLPVVNIGRRNDNQLVISDPSVSRLHAQLRAMKGHYVIFDLDSSSGTFVNGNRIHQQELIPGDVILVGGIPLVYGEEQAVDTRDLTLIQ